MKIQTQSDLQRAFDEFRAGLPEDRTDVAFRLVTLRSDDCRHFDVSPDRIGAREMAEIAFFAVAGRNDLVRWLFDPDTVPGSVVVWYGGGVVVCCAPEVG